MYLKFSGSGGLVWWKAWGIQRHLFIFWQVVPRKIDFPDFDKVLITGTVGGRSPQWSLARCCCKCLTSKLEIVIDRWCAPLVGLLVRENYRSWLARSIKYYYLIILFPVNYRPFPCYLWDVWLENQIFAKGWKWLYHLQWICLAYDQVNKEYYHALIIQLHVINVIC